jgi:hypothetical protein
MTKGRKNMNKVKKALANTIVAVIGGHICDRKVEQQAHKIGKKVTEMGAKLISGGLGGVMMASAKGAKEAGGITIGILPGEKKNDANPYIDIAIPTGLGLARNTLVVRSADIIIALPGEYGTLSEIAFSLVLGKKVINLSNWDIPGAIKVNSVDAAIGKLKELLCVIA